MPFSFGSSDVSLCLFYFKGDTEFLDVTVVDEVVIGCGYSESNTITGGT